MCFLFAFRAEVVRLCACCLFFAPRVFECVFFALVFDPRFRLRVFFRSEVSTTTRGCSTVCFVFCFHSEVSTASFCSL